MTNSSASYVQNRAGPAIIERVARADLTSEINRLTFVDSFDGFLTEDDGPSKEQLYYLSDKSVKQFQEVLENFSQMIKTREAFVKLNIPIREPRDFDINYFLEVARLISDRRGDPETIGVCKRFVKRCCQKAVEHKDVVNGLISLAPTDIYGSLITGGFTIILAAAERHEKLRERIQEHLAKIPSKLSQVTEISGIQIQRARLHKCADHVFVSIFTVLERIIEKLTRSWQDKIKGTFKSSSGTIEDAFNELGANIAEFNNEANVCANLRMGRLEENGHEVKAILESIKTVLDGQNLALDETAQNQGTMEGKILKAILDGKEENAILHRQLTGFLNVFYRFITSNPDFDYLNGTVSRRNLNQNDSMKQVSIGEIADAKRPDGNKKMIESWLQRLGKFVPDSGHHIQQCLNRAGSLGTQEQDKTQYIMNSERFRNWLATPATGVLVARSETAPEDLFNFMSLATSMLALALGGSTNFAVLSFFCGLRKNESIKEEDSGIMGLLKSLNGQLLKFILTKHPGIKLGIQEDDKVWGKSGKDSKYANRLFKKLLSLLPDGCVVFVLFDSVSRVSGDKTRIDDLVSTIHDLARQQLNGVVIKMLVTDPGPWSRTIKRLRQDTIHVPDDVDGWNCGMNTNLLNQSIRSELRGLHSGHQSDREASSDGSNDTGSEDYTSSEAEDSS